MDYSTWTFVQTKKLAADFQCSDTKIKRCPNILLRDGFNSLRSIARDNKGVLEASLIAGANLDELATPMDDSSIMAEAANSINLPPARCNPHLEMTPIEVQEERFTWTAKFNSGEHHCRTTEDVIKSLRLGVTSEKDYVRASCGFDSVDLLEFTATATGENSIKFTSSPVDKALLERAKCSLDELKRLTLPHFSPFGPRASPFVADALDVQARMERFIATAVAFTTNDQMELLRNVLLPRRDRLKKIESSGTCGARTNLMLNPLSVTHGGQDTAKATEKVQVYKNFMQSKQYFDGPHYGVCRTRLATIYSVASGLALVRFRERFRLNLTDSSVVNSLDELRNTKEIDYVTILAQMLVAVQYDCFTVHKKETRLRFAGSLYPVFAGLFDTPQKRAEFKSKFVEANTMIKQKKGSSTLIPTEKLTLLMSYLETNVAVLNNILVKSEQLSNLGVLESIEGGVPTISATTQLCLTANFPGTAKNCALLVRLLYGARPASEQSIAWPLISRDLLSTKDMKD